MLNQRQEFGKVGEELAVAYLKKKGYKIIEQNYRNKLGEIDIIAKDHKTLVFVEVKSRKSARLGHPKEAVTYKKQRKISMVALSYLKSTRQLDIRARFDVVTIYTIKGQPRVEIFNNAFDLAYS